MNADAERLDPTLRMTSERIIDFSPEKLKAPFLLRLGSALVDYILVVIAPVVGLLLSTMMGHSGSNLIGGSYNNIGWLIAIMIGAVNSVIMPAAIGQSFGKMLAGLRIVRLDGTDPSFGSVLFRNILGYVLTLASFGIGFFLSVFSSKGRALHDYLAGTVVIHAGKRHVVKS